MAKNSKSRNFTAEEEAQVISALKTMEKDSAFNTESQYSGNVEKHPNNRITFTEKHMDHLKKFPNINPDQYILNLKLMTRV
ncbi:hypothetical protein KBD20_00730 [Candidatus Saccharibacteria bacterium]|nr:hypothetical protein [Candidatus Saccharibacteria bacterium]